MFLTYNTSMKHQKGFTLIELLVVIAIIGLLSSVILAALSSARMKARVARRYSDFKQLNTALELYKDKYNTYPNTSNSWLSVCKNPGDGPWGLDRSGSNGFIPDLAPEFMPILPVDPSGCASVGVTEGYHYASNGAGYKLQTGYLSDTMSLCLPNGDFADPTVISSPGAYKCAIYSPDFSGR